MGQRRCDRNESMMRDSRTIGEICINGAMQRWKHDYFNADLICMLQTPSTAVIRTSARQPVVLCIRWPYAWEDRFVRLSKRWSGRPGHRHSTTAPAMGRPNHWVSLASSAATPVPENITEYWPAMAAAASLSGVFAESWFIGKWMCLGHSLERGQKITFFTLHCSISFRFFHMM